MSPTEKRIVKAAMRWAELRKVDPAWVETWHVLDRKLWKACAAHAKRRKK